MESLQDKQAGFQQLQKQILEEIELVSKTFDYSVFAGFRGPLSGSAFEGKPE